MWKVEKVISRVVIENHPGRLLSPDEVVHHKSRGKLSHNIQLYGRTAELERAISENLVREYTAHDNSEQTFDEGMRRGHTPAT